MTPRPQYMAPNYKGSAKLAGKVAIVTGGDSGIGRSVAVLFAREGANVAIIYLPEEQSDAEEAAKAVRGENQEVLLLPGDVSSASFCRDAVKKTVEKFGRLDILVNNAAYQETRERFEEVSEDDWDHTFKVNILWLLLHGQGGVVAFGTGKRHHQLRVDYGA